MLHRRIIEKVGMGQRELGGGDREDRPWLALRPLINRGVCLRKLPARAGLSRMDPSLGERLGFPFAWM